MKIPCAAFCVLLLIGCATTKRNFLSDSLSGMVYDYANKPVSGYEVELTKKGTLVKYRATTDISGRFIIYSISSGDYKVTGVGNGYEPWTGHLELQNPGQILYLRVADRNQLVLQAQKNLQEQDYDTLENTVASLYSIDSKSSEAALFKATLHFINKNYTACIESLEAIKNMPKLEGVLQKMRVAAREANK